MNAPRSGCPINLTLEALRAFAAAMRKRLRTDDGTFARNQVRAVAQRVEVVSRKEVRIRGLRCVRMNRFGAP